MTPPPTDQFVPLVTAAPSPDKREFQITVIPQKEQSQSFQSLEKGMGGQALFRKNCEPVLSLQRDGGRITNIRIQCSCGQTIDLACIYEGASRSSDAKFSGSKPPTPTLPGLEASEIKPPEPQPAAPPPPDDKPSPPKATTSKASPAKKPSKK